MAYSEEIKRQVLSEIESGKTVAELAKEHKISTVTIYKWRKNIVGAKTIQKELKKANKRGKKGYSEEIKNQAIKLYLEGNSGLAVSRILGISKNMCLYWVKKYAKKIKPKKVFNERVEVIEMDELYSFIERKKQNLCDNASK